MAKDLRVKQLRTTQVIVSGSNVGTIPSFLIYSASAATGVDGTYHAALLNNVGTDVWMFISGSKSAQAGSTSGTGRSDAILFGGDVVISGTLYAEKQVMEVDTLYNSDLMLSGGFILGDQGAGADANGVGSGRIKSLLGTNSGSLFVSTGSLYFASKPGGTYSETKIETSALSSFSSAVINVANDSIVFIDADDSSNSKSETVSDFVGLIASNGLAAAAGQLSVNIDGLSALGGTGVHQTDDHFMFSDGGTEKKITFSNLEDAIFANVSGDATIAAGGDISLGVTAITNQTNMTGDVADTDELLINDGGTLKRVDFSLARDAVFNDVSGDATVAAGGALTIAANAVEGSMINSNAAGTGLSYASSALNVDINGLGADANAGNLSDEIAIADNSDSNNAKKITITQLKALVDTNTTYTAGDGLALGGTEFSLNIDTLSALGGTGLHQTDDHFVFSDGGTEKKITFSNLEDAIFASVSGDATVAAGGDISLGAGAITNQTNMTGDVADTDELLISDAGTLKRIDFSVFRDAVFNDVSSGATVAAGGAVTIKGFTASSDTFATPPTAAGTNAVAIGNKAIASGDGSIAMGTSTTNNTDATGLHSLAIGGDDATASGQYSAAIGGYANTAAGDYSVALGRSSAANGANAIAIGKSLVATEDDSIAIGNSSNDAKIALSGSVEVFSDLIVPADIVHAGDSDTKITFGTNEVSITAGNQVTLKTSVNQAFVLANTYSGTDTNFYVAGTVGAKGDTSTTKGTAVFAGDTVVSGTLFFDNNLKIFKDGNDLKFDDGNNTVKTLTQLATVPDDSEFFNGVHAGSNNAKAATTASFSVAGTQGTTYYTENVGTDVLMYVSGGLRSDTAAYGKTTTVFGGAVVFSGSTTYLGDTIFTTVAATTAVKTPEIQDGSGNESIRIESQKIAVGTSINADPNAIFEAPLADNTQAATTNETSHFNIFLNNRSVQTNAFAGIAFDVSTEVDADSIGAAIRAERDTGASTTASNHSANLTFATNNAGDDALTERMRITHDGKVGIGVDPSYKLDIDGDLRVRGNDLRDNSGNVFISGDGSANTIIANDLTVSGGDIIGPTDGDLLIKSDGNMTFRIDADNDETSQQYTFQNNASTDIAVLDEGGNLTLSGDIEVVGNNIKDAGGSSGITFDGSGNTAIDGHLTITGNIIKASDGGSTITMDTSDNVTIGGTLKIPQYLEHDGDADTRINFGTNNITFEAGGTAIFKLDGSSSPKALVVNEASNDVDFRVESNNETHMLHVDGSSDRVGIGIGTPATTLEIKGASADETALQIKDSQSSDVLVKMYHENGEDDGIVDIYANGSRKVQLHGNGSSYFMGGNVGIGLIDPDAPVEILSTSAQLKLSYDADSAVTLGVDSAGSLTLKTTQTDSDIIFQIDDNTSEFTAVTIDGSELGSTLFTPAAGGYISVDDAGTSGKSEVYGNGKIDLTGFGTTSHFPQMNFYKSRGSDGSPAVNVDDDTLARFMFNGYDDGYATSAAIYVRADGAHGDDTTDTGGKIEFYTVPDGSSSMQERLTIRGSGNIGIGQADPQAKLHVYGGSNAFPVVNIESADSTMGTDDAMLQIDASDTSMGSDNYFIEFTQNGTKVGSIDSEVLYTTFTGGHPTQVKDNAVPTQGSIMISTGKVIHREGISNAWVESTVCTSVKNKAVVGVYNGGWGTTSVGEMHVYNAIGEGQVLVTDVGGDIEIGDYICSSDVSGHGMKQDDDLLHNYTVAKALENVSFASIEADENGQKSVLIACTYHCG